MNAIAAGTTVQNGNGVDLSLDGGYDGVLFIFAAGTLTASQVTALKAQQSDDDGNSDDYSDLASSLTTAMDDADDNDLVLLDVFQPGKRWVRPVVNRATANAVIDGVIALLYRAKRQPTTQESTTVSTSKAIHQPVEGTA